MKKPKSKANKETDLFLAEYEKSPISAIDLSSMSNIDEYSIEFEKENIQIFVNGLSKEGINFLKEIIK